MSMDAGEAELMAIRSQFCIVVARWRLTQSDLRVILGQSAGLFVEGRILPNHLSSDAERRMRLLVRLDSGLTRRFPDDDIGNLIRQTDSFGARPLDMLGELSDLRLAVALAEGRSPNDCIAPALFRKEPRS